VNLDHLSDDHDLGVLSDLQQLLIIGWGEAVC
jgi:hypothetical protein